MAGRDRDAWEGDGVGEVLVGVLAGSDAVAAHLVTRTPFGRLRHGGRRAVEDDDDLGTGPGIDPGGPLGATWAGCIAGAVEKLTFGLPAARLRVGVAVDGEVDPDGRAARVRGREGCEDLPREVARVLSSRGIELAGEGAVAAVDLATAWATGEAASPVGLAGHGGPALVLVWTDEPAWRLVDASAERSSPSVTALGRPEVDLALAARSASDDPGTEAALARLAAEARALLEGGAREATRLVLSGSRMQARAGGRSDADLRLPFRAVLPPRLLSSDASAASIDDIVWVSRERHAAALGAALAAAGGIR